MSQKWYNILIKIIIKFKNIYYNNVKQQSDNSKQTILYNIQNKFVYKKIKLNNS